MTHKITSNLLEKPRAFLFGVDWRSEHNLLSIEDSLEELAVLCRTAGIEVVGSGFQKINKPDSSTLIGSGKLKELKCLTTETDSTMVIFDDELSPRHLRDVQKELGEKITVMDRTAIILDIFAQHAHTREGALQVELASYEYRLPRLTRAWTHLARQTGGTTGRAGTGGVGLRGPGETQLEMDRREISRKISRLKNELESVRKHRSQYRIRRKNSGLPVVAIVGYTNAGKSTLLNTLTSAGVVVADQLFATLDPTTRRVRLPGGRTILLTDTVGFIQKLPLSLLSAFRATLEEIAEADLLLHIVDVSHPNARQQVEAVHQILESLGAENIPVITGLNKIDRISELESDYHLQNFPNTIPFSALTGKGIDRLLLAVEKELYGTLINISVKLPFSEGKLVDIFHLKGFVDSIVYRSDGIMIKGKLPAAWLADFRPFMHTQLHGKKASTS
jgi:GTP-binding protein HflX